MRIRKVMCIVISALMVVALMPTTAMAKAPKEDKKVENKKVEEKIAEEDYQLNYRDVNFAVEDADFSEVYQSVRGESLPSAYSSVENGMVSYAKNQGSYGTCWAFSATSVCESSLIKNDSNIDKNVDLSDLQLANYFYNEKIDPLGNANGDKTQNMSDTKLDQGGNNVFTMWGLANWTNGAREIDLPYSSTNCSAANSNKLNSSLANGYDIAHLQNAYIIPYGTSSDNLNKIKQAIKDYGSVACSYYHSSANYNSSKGSYYTTTSSSNHAVTIVGWNDSYSKDNFGSSDKRKSVKPSYNGAWLVKNSWGTDWGTDGDSNATNSGKQGYFWLSYYDSSIKSTGKVFVYDFEPIENYDYNYQYDGSCGLKTYSVYSGDKIGATYTIKGLGSDEESIDAVGMGFYSTDMSGTAKIYADSTFEKPTSGTLVASVPFATTYAGYYTFEIDNPPVLQKGQTYSVVFEMNKSGSIFIDTSYQNGDWIKFTANTTNDKTFRISSGGTYTNFANSGYTARVKAYTNKAVPTVKKYKITYNANGGTGGPETQLVSEGDSFTLSNVKPERQGFYFLGWATSSSASQADYLIGVEYDPISEDLPLYAVWKQKPVITIEKSTENLLVGESTTISAEASNQGQIIWSSSDENIVEVEDGTITAKNTGVAEVKATLASDSEIYKTCTVTVKKHATNIGLSASEKELKKGENFKLSATVTPQNYCADTVVWESSNEQVATVDNSGNVAAVGKGDCVITAKSSYSDQVKAECSISVYDYILSLGLDNEKITLKPGESKDVVLTYAPYDNKTKRNISAQSSNNNITVTKVDENNGQIKYNISVSANATSDATVTFKDSYSNKSVTCAVAVDLPFTPITIDKEFVSLIAGKTQQLIAKSSKTVYWESSNTAIATVNQAGLVTTVSAGTCKIKAYTSNTDYVECTFTILPVLSAVSVKGGAPTVNYGKSIDLKSYYTISWSKGTPTSDMYKVTYSTTSTYGSVNENGIFTANNATTATKAEPKAGAKEDVKANGKPGAKDETKPGGPGGKADAKSSAKITVKVTCGSQEKSCEITVNIKK